MTIDDNIDTTEAVTDYCNMKGIECEVANKGQKGLFEIQKQDYDIILLDMAIPEYSGFDILNQLKKQNVKQRWIVVLTAYNLEMEDFKEYVDAGVIEILKKPISLDDLDNVVKRHMMKVSQPLSKIYPI